MTRLSWFMTMRPSTICTCGVITDDTDLQKKKEKNINIGPYLQSKVAKQYKTEALWHLQKTS
jgi:hypothetical protein